MGVDSIYMTTADGLKRNLFKKKGFHWVYEDIGDKHMRFDTSIERALSNRARGNQIIGLSRKEFASEYYLLGHLDELKPKPKAPLAQHPELEEFEKKLSTAIMS